MIYALLCCFQADNGCNVELLLDLLETKCHVVNPQHFEDCELRRVDERVNANQTIVYSSSPLLVLLLTHMQLEGGHTDFDIFSIMEM